MVESLQILENNLVEEAEEQHIDHLEDDDSDDDSDSSPKEKQKEEYSVKLLPHESEKDGLNLNISIDDWIKNRMMANKPPKTYEKVFSKQIFKSPNTLKFTIEDIKEEENENDEEMIEQNNNSTTRMRKVTRGYSLYTPNAKYKKSRQDKELERVIAKDIQSNKIIREQLGDG